MTIKIYPDPWQKVEKLRYIWPGKPIFLVIFMIPEAKKAAVTSALQCTFGVTEFEDISALTAGLSSALIFKIVVKEKPYLLRVITRRDALSDPTHWYNCMQMAADAGIAPHIWYTNIDDRISITDFVKAKPFPLSEARVKLPALLKRLHSLPPFPHRVNYLDAVAGFIKKFQEAKVLPEKMTGELFSQYEKIVSIYPRNSSDLVACHNDLKPENILFDGDRVWLVDWEAAFANDRYMDLAIVANFVVANDDEERDYLKTYFGEDVNEYHHARFFLMRQVLHMSYFTYFMLIVSSAGCKIDFDAAKPDFREFNNDMWAGKIDLADNNARQPYAWVHMQQLQRNFNLKRFEYALHIVSNYKIT